MHFLRQIIYNMLLFMALSVVFKSSFYILDWQTALIAAIVLGILNTLVRPVLFILSLPINLLTLGLFSIVLNACMLELTSSFVGREVFSFSSFPLAMLIAVIMSMANAVIADYYHRN